jgi:hypothetical protein
LTNFSKKVEIMVALTNLQKIDASSGSPSSAPVLSPATPQLSTASSLQKHPEAASKPSCIYSIFNTIWSTITRIFQMIFCCRSTPTSNAQSHIPPSQAPANAAASKLKDASPAIQDKETAAQTVPSPTEAAPISSVTMSGDDASNKLDILRKVPLYLLKIKPVNDLVETARKCLTILLTTPPSDTDARRVYLEEAAQASIQLDTLMPKVTAVVDFANTQNLHFLNKHFNSRLYVSHYIGDKVFTSFDTDLNQVFSLFLQDQCSEADEEKVYALIDKLRTDAVNIAQQRSRASIQINNSQSDHVEDLASLDDGGVHSDAE